MRRIARVLVLALCAGRVAWAQYNPAPPATYTTMASVPLVAAQICTGPCVITGAETYNIAGGPAYLQLFDSATQPITASTQQTLESPVCANNATCTLTLPAGGVRFTSGAWADGSFLGDSYSSINGQNAYLVVHWRKGP
jgi:hypothetical protein